VFVEGGDLCPRLPRSIYTLKGLGEGVRGRG
jgi:hypothetical protein